jgi:hypothetical protein
MIGASSSWRDDDREDDGRDEPRDDDPRVACRPELRRVPVYGMLLLSSRKARRMPMAKTAGAGYETDQREEILAERYTPHGGRTPILRYEPVAVERMSAVGGC